MPELPEVETVVRDLAAAGLPGRTIREVRVEWPRTVAPLTPEAFRKRMVGRTIRGVSRRAKYIVVELSGAEWLLIHLRMTGQLTFADPAAPADAHVHVRLTLDDGRELRFRDTRKFGRWRLVPDAHDALRHLGPEPLDPAFTVQRLRARLAEHTRQLKPLLLDQHFIAGLGNIYVDEALFAAGLDPRRSSRSLTDDESRRLHRAIRTVLRRAVRLMGTSLGKASTNFYSVAGRRGRNQDRLQVFRRHGQDCPRCGAAIERLVVAQRSTHICPVCQQ